MKKFTEFLTEMASSVEDATLGHLTHVKDIAHEDPSYGKYAIDVLKDFKKHRQGKTPAGFGASIKHDGGSSVIVKHDDNGVAVTDKHRAIRGVEARNANDIKKHFGHAPGYAAAMQHLLTHGHELVSKGSIVQGDLLYTPKDGTSKAKDDHVEYTPNRIKYKAKTKAPIGLAVHTQYTDGVAHAVSPEALKHTPKVFVPHHDYTNPDPRTFSKADREGAHEHISKAEELMSQHATHHLDPEHIANVTIYNNRSARVPVKPTTHGYMQHLAGERDKAASKLKTPAGKERVNAKYNAMIDHVSKNKEHFDRSFAIRHHMEKATEHLLNGIKHPDLQTTVDNKHAPGEGVVIHKKDRNGLMRPIGKLVPQVIQHALGNNPRFKE